jgi:predicted ester cyclase
MSDLTKAELELIRTVYEGMWNGHDPNMAHSLFERSESVAEFVSRFLAAFPDLQHTVEETLVQDRRVAIRFAAHGTHQGSWMGFEPTGKKIDYTGATIARIERGKIVGHRTWWDTWGLVQQIRGG